MTEPATGPTAEPTGEPTGEPTVEPAAGPTTGPTAGPAAGQAAGRPRPVVLRYADDWGELAARLDADRAAGLSPSTVRDALHGWLDGGSFSEIGTLVRRASTSYRGGDTVDEAPNDVPVDGMVAGWGRYGGRLVFVAADDPGLGSRFRGGAGAAKAARVRHHALVQSAPLVQVFAAGRVEPDTFIGAEFVRFGYGVDLDLESDTSEHILKIALVTAPIDDQAALEASWCHLVVLAGPTAAIMGATGDEALARGFGDLVCDDLPSALAVAGEAVAHLPASRFDEAHGADQGAAAPGELLLDDGWALELAPGWQPAVRTRLGTIGGHVVGAAEIATRARLDAPASAKLARLARFCATFGLPFVLGHTGWDLPAAPSRADVDAYDALREALQRSAAPFVEVAQGEHRLEVLLRARPTWSLDLSATATSAATADAVVTPAGARQAVAGPWPYCARPRRHPMPTRW